MASRAYNAKMDITIQCESLQGKLIDNAGIHKPITARMAFGAETTPCGTPSALASGILGPSGGFLDAPPAFQGQVSARKVGMAGWVGVRRLGLTY
jgi:hypothetical protein